MNKIAQYSLPRSQATWIAFFLGMTIGLANLYLPLDFSLRPALFGWLIGAVLLTILLHEGVHGGAAFLLGYKPIFGIKVPFVYTTFEEKISRRAFLFIALSPLFFLDTFFAAMYLWSPWQLLFNFCFTINTLGAIGDVWMVWKILGHSRSCWIQDTQTGFEIWE